VYPSAVGFGSASDKDKAEARAEIWTPLWEQSIQYSEIRMLLREGRASLGSKPAQNGLEFAEAACSLGVDRGVSAFVRYSLLKRRGDSYIALPAGRFRVTYRSESDLVQELGPILDQADRSIQPAPASYQSLRRQVDEAMFDLLLRGGSGDMLGVAAAMGRLHRWILLSDKDVWLKSGLSRAWINNCGDSAEVRIAAAIAAIRNPAIRENLKQDRPEFAWTGSGLPARLAATLQRRVMKADSRDPESDRRRFLPRARIADVSDFLEARLKDGLIEDLLFTFTLVDWTERGESVESWREDDPPVCPVYTLLKHLFWAEPIANAAGQEVSLKPDLRVLALLRSEDVQSAAEAAIRRLRIAGFAPIDAEYLSVPDPERLAAALLIPVSNYDFLRAKAATV
jgi:CRISPR-associated protein Csx17